MLDLGKLGFEFTDKISAMNYCVKLASLMQDYRDDQQKMDNLLRLMYGPIEFDKERTTQLAQMLSNPDYSMIFLSSKLFEKDTFANTEPYYKVPYDKEPYSEEMKKAVYYPTIANDGLNLDLPPAN